MSRSAEFSVVSDDPFYQRIKQRLLNHSDQELEGILNELGPVASKRKRNSLLVAVVTAAIPVLGVTVASALDNFGLNGLASNIREYTSWAINDWPFILGYGLFIGSGKRKRDQYALIAADAVLSERREHHQVF